MNNADKGIWVSTGINRVDDHNTQVRANFLFIYIYFFIHKMIHNISYII